MKSTTKHTLYIDEYKEYEDWYINMKRQCRKDKDKCILVMCPVATVFKPVYIRGNIYTKEFVHFMIQYKRYIF